jgi:hypothetical protein
MATHDREPENDDEGNGTALIERPPNMRQVLTDEQRYALFGEKMPNGTELVNGIAAAAGGLSLLAARYGAAVLTGEIRDRPMKEMTVADKFALEAMPTIAMEQKRRSGPPPAPPKGDPVREILQEAEEETVRMSSGGG